LNEVIETLDRDELSKLPANLLLLAFAKITNGDEIFAFEDNQNILISIGENGKPEHISKLIKVVKRKLLMPDQIEDGLDILESIRELSQEEITLIKVIFTVLRIIN
jgi:hypothetical protein